MDELHGAGKRQEDAAFGGQALPGREEEERTEALSAGEHGMPHGLEKERIPAAEEPAQLLVYGLFLLSERVLNPHEGYP
jgi:hypothetical protein